MRIVSLICASLLFPMLAWAEPKTASEWFNEGENEYNLGNFDKAADAFKQGFALETNESKKAAYLYNVGQAYRQEKKCQDAIFFYKRFLSLKQSDTVKPLTPEKKAETERILVDLEECVKQQDIARNRKPDDTTKVDGSSTTSNTTTGKITTGKPDKRVGQAGGDDGGGEDDGGGIRKTATPQPTLVQARLEGGVAKISAGDLAVPIQGTGTLIGGYPIALQPKLGVELGAAFNFTPVPFNNTITSTKHTASLTSLLANAGLSYEVAPKLNLRGELGLGVLLFGGIDEMGSPFTKNGAPTTGTLAMFAVRVGASVDYAVTPNVYVVVAPVTFSYSPAKDGLAFTALTRLDFMAGVGYRM